MRDTFVTIALEPVAGFCDFLLFLVALRLVIHRGIAQRGDYRIDSSFQQTDQG